MKKMVIIILILAAVFAAFEIGWSLHVKQTTGTLRVTASDSAATITVGQANRAYTNVGSGSAKIRLTPGMYQVIASKGKAQATQNVQISQNHTTSAKLTIPKPAQQTTNVAAANALIKYLPFTGKMFDYRVSYTYQITPSAAIPQIIVTAPTEAGHQDALKWIKSVGFDPSQLNVKYVNQPLD